MCFPVSFTNTFSHGTLLLAVFLNIAKFKEMNNIIKKSMENKAKQQLKTILIIHDIQVRKDKRDM